MRPTTNSFYSIVCAIFLSMALSSCSKEEAIVAPTSVFTADKESGDTPLTVKFTNTSTNAVSYLWDFGDGTTTFERNPTHTFTNISLTNVASITVKLSVANTDKTIAASTKAITVNKMIAPTVKDVDGNVYKTIKIGNQTWMAENLRTTKLNDGTAIINVTNDATWMNLTTPAFCTYNNTSDAAAITTYGRLYNWPVINTGKLAPAGWHVATDAEWTTLTTFLGGESLAGGKLKESGTTHWKSPNTDATNESAFNALPHAYRWWEDGAFYDLGAYASFWTSSPSGTKKAWGRDLLNNSAKVDRYDVELTCGFGVRCVKD